MIFVLFDVTRNMQTTYPKILQSMGITHGITMVPILYPRTSACSTAHSKRDTLLKSVLLKSQIRCWRHTVAVTPWPCLTCFSRKLQ